MAAETEQTSRELKATEAPPGMRVLDSDKKGHRMAIAVHMAQFHPARYNMLLEKAVMLWDMGWKRIDEDRPGTLRWAMGDNRTLLVELEVWIFIRACYFAIGDYNSRQQARS